MSAPAKLEYGEGNDHDVARWTVFVHTHARVWVHGGEANVSCSSYGYVSCPHAPLPPTVTVHIPRFAPRVGRGTWHDISLGRSHCLFMAGNYVVCAANFCETHWICINIYLLSVKMQVQVSQEVKSVERKTSRFRVGARRGSSHCGADEGRGAVMEGRRKWRQCGTRSRRVQ